MQKDVPYLKASPKTGKYGYRRAIKEEHRYLFGGKREDKQAFHTKDFDEAYRKWKVYDQKHEDTLALHNASDGRGSTLPTEEALRQVKILNQENLLPAKMPTLAEFESEQDIDDFIQEREYYRRLEHCQWEELRLRQEAEEAYNNKTNNPWNISFPEEIYSHIRIDWPDPSMADNPKKLYSRWHSLQWAKDQALENVADQASDRGGYRTLPQGDPALIRYKLLSGEAKISVDITMRMVRDFYIQQNIEKRSRNPKTKADHRKNVITLWDHIKTLHVDGLDGAVNDLEQYDIRKLAERAWPVPQTRKRRLSTLQSTINTWNNGNDKRQVDNPFTGLRKEASDLYNRNEDQQQRRFFTPDELAIFKANIRNIKEEELRLIGLLMTHAGSPVMEIIGLLRDDVALKHNIPHIDIQPNKIRRLDKGRLERVIPIYGELLELLQTYICNRNFGQFDPLFPNTWNDGMTDSKRTSSVFGNCIENLRPELKEVLKPYSVRHTLVVRAQAADISQAEREMMVGHSTKGSSSIHRTVYGTSDGPERMLTMFKKVDDTVDWGHLKYSDF